MKAKLELRGFDEFANMIDTREFKKQIRFTMRRAMEVSGRAAKKHVQNQIGSGRFKENSHLTMAIKGRNEPLVQSGKLKKSISWSLTNWNRVKVGIPLGINSSSFNSKGAARSLSKIATFVHDGYTIQVTTKMRRYFVFLSNEIPGVKPLAKNTTKLIVKGRPFLKPILDDEFAEVFLNNCKKAVLEAWRRYKFKG